MNYSRLVLAAFGGMVASFAVGSLVFWLVPVLVKEGHKYPAVFRPKEEMILLRQRIHYHRQQEDKSMPTEQFYTDCLGRVSHHISRIQMAVALDTR
jgi:hypothetical protein